MSGGESSLLQAEPTRLTVRRRKFVAVVMGSHVSGPMEQERRLGSEELRVLGITRAFFRAGKEKVVLQVLRLMRAHCSLTHAFL